jgi:hypothetical protein
MEAAMKTFIYLIVSAGLVLMTACRSTSAMPDNSKSGEIPLLSTPKPVDATDEPATASLGINLPISPTQVITENTVMSGTQVQPPLIDESAESIKLAKQDLAQRLRVSVDSITVAAVIGQEFSIDAFNCQASKERIAREEPPQVISGQSILLIASGHRYEYHASGQTVIFCRPLLY